MALRLQGGGISNFGSIEWDVLLYGPGSGVINAHLAEDIFTLRYEGGDADLNTPIIPSTLTFTIKATNQSEIAANQALLEEIALADEGEFIVKVYRNSALYWVGLVLSDQIQFSDDRLPRPLKITAVDGLARLKEIEYNKDGTEFAAVEVYLSQHIINALKKTSLFDELSPGLKVSTGWTNAENTYDSFLEGIRLNHIVWLYIDGKGSTGTSTNKRSKTAWQVLEEIAREFHARVLMTQGSFWFIQIPQYLTAATAIIHTFDANGTVTGNTAGFPIAYSNAYTQRIGASWEFQPAIKRTKITYRHSTAKNVNIEFNFLTGPVVVKDVDSFSGTAKLFLSFTLTYPTQLPASYPTYLSHQHKFRLTLRVGDKWLKRTANVNLGQIIYSDPQWVATAADYEFYVYPNFSPNGSNRYLFNLVTPPLPENGDASFTLGYVFTRFNGSGTTPTITPFEWSVNNGNFQVIPEGLIESLFNETVYTEESNTNATKQLEIVSTFGDGPYSYTLTTMKARRPEGTPPPITQTWTGSGKTGPIHAVLAASIIKFSGKATKKINLPIFGGGFYPHGLVEYEGDFYVLLSADFEAKSDTWNGVFVLVADNPNGITLPPIKYISKKPSIEDVIQAPETGFPGNIPDDGRLDLPEVKKADLTALRAGTIPTTTDEPIEVGVVTSIPVNPFELDRVLLAGDKIVITDVYTGKPTVFTVATTTTAGASSISVVSQSVTDRIVDGSYIQLDPEYLYTRALTNLANIGTGAQIFKDKVNQVANLRTILAGAGISIAQNANEIVITSTALGTMSSFTISGDGGTPNAIVDSETLLFSGSAGISTFISTNQVTFSLNISGLISATVATGDYLAIYDISAGFHRRITIQDILSLVPGGFTSFSVSGSDAGTTQITNAETLIITTGGGLKTVTSNNQITVFLDFQAGLSAVTPSTSDIIAIYDVSGASHARITIQDILNLAGSFNIAANTGTANAITTGETLTISGGTATDTTVSTNQISVNFNLMKLSPQTPTTDDWLVFYDNGFGVHVRSTILSILNLASFNIAGDTGTANAIANGETLSVSGGIGIASQAVTNGVIVNLDVNSLSEVTPQVVDYFPLYDDSSGGHAKASFIQMTNFSITDGPGNTVTINNSTSFNISGGNGLTSQAGGIGIQIRLNFSTLPSFTPAGPDTIPLLRTGTGHGAATIAQIKQSILDRGNFTGTTNGSGQVTISHTSTNVGGYRITATLWDNPSAAYIGILSKGSGTATFQIRDFSGASAAGVSISFDWILINY